MHYDDDHGTQVEYYAASGYAYLWYPGNNRLIISSFREDLSAGEVCFSYRGDIYNPATDEYAYRDWCHDLDEFWAGVRESIVGDPFELSTRERVPFVIDWTATTFQSLQERAGLI